MFLFEPSGPVMILSYLLVAAICGDAIRRAGITEASIREHMIWASATAAVFLGHQMTIHVSEGFELHYMGSAFLALLLGYSRAIVSMALVLLASALMDQLFSVLALQIIFHAVIPIALMLILSRAIQKTLPLNLFVFLLGNGFIALFVTYAVEHFIALGGRSLLLGSDAFVLADLTPYALLLASGEAWLEGMIITILVVFAPGAVRMFDDAAYLQARSDHNQNDRR